MSAYLDGLNDPQRAAVTADAPALLVLAGAGTGKTRVLTARLAHILATGQAWPSQILAVTFTNKAAAEMRARVERLVGEGPRWLGTFHALAARMLRAHAERVEGLSSNFTILDTDDQIRALKQIMEARGVDTKKNPPRALAARISRWKDAGVRPEGVRGNDAERALYQAYQARLKSLNACDFGDLLLHTVGVFERCPDVLADYHRRFRVILVDEYQDTNAVQYAWLRALARGGAQVCCVGDDDQSIYGWRGAEVGNILRFEADFPGAQVVRLEQNYRSTGHILAAADGLIGHNRGRLGKTLWSADDPGERVIVAHHADGEAEAAWVARRAADAHAAGVALSDIAVLVRAGFLTRAFEEAFLRRGLPYRVIGGLKFFERAEVRDALAYLRVVAQSADDLALERIINVPRRGIGPSVLGTLHAAARGAGASLHDTCVTLCEASNALKPAPRRSIFELMQGFARWRAAAGQGVRPADLLAQILDESGYMAMAKADTTPEGPGRRENLNELLGSLEDYDTLAAFLEHVALVTDADRTRADGAAVSLMTLHAAKGLEFDCVFLPGWEEGLFPSARTLDEHGTKGLEEERRLAYVGLTRARRRAHVSFAHARRVYGRWTDCIASRFVDELPAGHTARVADGRAGPPAPPVTQNEAPFDPGARVTHPTFGAGTVVGAAGAKLDIAFDDGTQRRIMAGFVRAAA